MRCGRVASRYLCAATQWQDGLRSAAQLHSAEKPARHVTDADWGLPSLSGHASEAERSASDGREEPHESANSNMAPVAMQRIIRFLLLPRTVKAGPADVNKETKRVGRGHRRCQLLLGDFDLEPAFFKASPSSITKGTNKHEERR